MDAVGARRNRRLDRATVLVAVVNDDPTDGTPVVVTFAIGGAVFFGVSSGSHFGRRAAQQHRARPRLRRARGRADTIVFSQPRPGEACESRPGSTSASVPSSPRSDFWQSSSKARVRQLGRDASRAGRDRRHLGRGGAPGAAPCERCERCGARAARPAPERHCDRRRAPRASRLDRDHLGGLCDPRRRRGGTHRHPPRGTRRGLLAARPRGGGAPGATRRPRSPAGTGRPRAARTRAARRARAASPRPQACRRASPSAAGRRL